ncbi:MAG: endolytic transglycosylase MltG [Fusobacteriaceae bacterium]|jgi:UPF0755 protein|nr:endolytic transglycosylase MltG [Fusobacteriaceae bacterium]
MGKIFRALVTAVFVAGILAAAYFYMAVTGKNQYAHILEIKSGVPLIRSLQQLPGARSLPFRLYLKYFRDGGRKIKAGYYSIQGEKSVIEIIDLLEHGMDRIFKLTIPEGYTLEQIVNHLEKEGRIRREKFFEALMKKRESFPYETPEGNFEGYFYPETYFIPENAGEDIVVDTILHEFTRRFPPENWPDKKEFYKKLIMASILEREAMLDSEKPLMSSVFYNRLKKGMKLASDATVNFVFHYEKKRILYKDLEVDSPYNTYRNEGLPPAPICNPDALSIEAAWSPADTDYLFFVAKGDGGHFFSKTYKEHLQFQNQNKKNQNTANKNKK